MRIKHHIQSISIVYWIDPNLSSVDRGGSGSDNGSGNGNSDTTPGHPKTHLPRLLVQIGAERRQIGETG